MYSDPCAMLMMRETPKISDSPAATKNRPDADDSPLRAWKRKASRVMAAFYPSLHGEVAARTANSRAGFAVRSSTRSALPMTLSQRWEGWKPQSALAGRNFLTSESGGITEAPSTYLKSVMVPLPFSSAILPTKQPMV